MGQKITDPIILALLEASQIDEDDRQALEDSNVALVAALRGVVGIRNRESLKVARDLLTQVDAKRLKIKRS